MCVISDEIYGLLDYRHNHLSFANFYPDKTITTTGLSKWCGAGGWRFGAAFLYENIEAEFKQALIGIGSETYSCAPTPVQMAAKVAYSNFDRIRDYLKRQTDILKEIGTYCAERLSLSGIRVHQPEGGFYIFPDFALLTERLHTKGIFTSVELCQHLLKDTGVALLPASAFGFEHNHLSVRLAFVDFENPLAKSNFDLKTDCPNVVEGIDKICAWVANL
jgi:aspartate aminotransferase